MEASETKWVKSIYNITGVNLFRLGSLQIQIQNLKALCFFLIKNVHTKKDLQTMFYIIELILELLKKKHSEKTQNSETKTMKNPLFYKWFWYYITWKYINLTFTSIKSVPNDTKLLLSMSNIT